MEIHNLPDAILTSFNTRTNIMRHTINLNQHFKDEDFDCIYYSQLRWLREELECTSKILNLGCGAGRETFALMWKLRADETIGIDIDPEKIECAKLYAQTIQEFAEIVQQIAEMNDTREFRTWCENVPIEIRDGIAPQFCTGDICTDLLQTICRSAGYFDLIYCRNLLYLIAEDGEDKLVHAFRSIAHTVNPRTGRFVMVEPTTKDDLKYNFGTLNKQA